LWVYVYHCAIEASSTPLYQPSDDEDSSLPCYSFQKLPRPITPVLCALSDRQSPLHPVISSTNGCIPHIRTSFVVLKILLSALIGSRANSGAEGAMPGIASKESFREEDQVYSLGRSMPGRILEAVEGLLEGVEGAGLRDGEFELLRHCRLV
jgi:hypothetical protein